MQAEYQGFDKTKSSESLTLRCLYWCLPLFILVLQAAFTYAALHRLWYEDLAESVRNVYWLDKQQVYNGGSTMIGWYSLVLAFYKVVGFSPVAAKWVKLILAGCAWFATAYSLKHFLGYRKAIVPLCAIILSPVALYFNTFQYPMGLDLLFFPLEIMLLVFVGKVSLRSSALLAFVAGGLAMFASMAYPTFLFYLPACLFVLFKMWQGRHDCGLGLGFSSYALGLLTPFALAALYLDNFALFLSDTTHSGTGIFRGGTTLKGLSLELYWNNLVRTLSDFFVAGDSYYFYLPISEFSSWLGVCGVLAVAVLSYLAARGSKQTRVLVVLTLLLMLAALLLPALGTSTPGGRRSTGFLMGIYVLFVIAWDYGWTALQGHKRTLALSALGLLVIQHLWAISPNLEHVAKEQTFSAEPFFPSDKDPNLSLAFWYARAERNEPLVCQSFREPKGYCRFDEIFAAIQGHRRWNLGLLEELELLAMTEKLTEPFALSFETPSPPP